MKENQKLLLKKILPCLLIILGFVVIAYAYAPYVLQGKIVNQADTSSWRGMANEIITHNEAHPDDPALWTNSMFGGMPATQISVNYKGDLTEPLYDGLFWGMRPPSYLIISLIGGFLLFLAFGVHPGLAALGAIAITFCSYNMQIIQVGHNTKMAAIAFMPWVLAAAVYAYRKKAVLGSLLFALALGFQVKANHPQITYYLAIIIAGYGIAELCGAIRAHAFPKWLRTSALLLVFGLAGIATNANKLLPTYEFSEYTMRGGSELTHDAENQTGKGLKLDYATAWSYGIGETFNLLIPNFNGGVSSGALSRDSETYKVLRNYQGGTQMIDHMPLYWGPQPFTAGPMYMGAISIFLFVLGLIVIKGRYKWWIAGVSLLALLLSYGYHFMWLSELFFKYAPLYNKFRTVSMILVILQITIPVLAVLALNEVFFQGGAADGLSGRDAAEKKRLRRGTLIAAGITGGFCLLAGLFPGIAGDFSSPSDGMFGGASDIVEALRQDRRALLVKDAFVSLAYILVAAVVLLLAIGGKLKTRPAVALLTAAVLLNLWTVDRRYLNADHFVPEKTYAGQFAQRPVDRMILQDGDPYYRVLDLSVNTFNDAYVSYHHKTIGGYNPAKLQRYQDMIDFYISKEMSRIAADVNAALSTAQTPGELEAALGYYPVLSMLNTKYIVIDGNAAPLRYDRRLGNAWFVSKSLAAATADKEIALTGKIDPAQTAVIYDPEAAEGTEGSYDPEGRVELTAYSPNRLKFSASTEKGGLAVFSDIYYPAGWKAYVDGEEQEILRADYILRALKIGPGTHEIEFSYEPASFRTGRNISAASSAAILILLAAYLAAVFFRNRKCRKTDL